MIDQEDKSCPIIITEFMNRKSVDNLFAAFQIKKVSKNWTDTKKYITAIGIAYALSYLHSKELVHKNLRPSKILFDDDYYPHVSCLDMLLDSGNEQTTYLAPELLDNPQSHSKSSDVYAYSMIVYQLLTENPFKNLKIGNYPNINQVDDCLSSFFGNCCSSDPSDRFTIDNIIDILKTEEVKEAFGEVDDDEVDRYLSRFNLE